MNYINGGVTSPQGFKASGIYVGIKKKRKDMALVVSTVPAISAGTFTTNLVKAAPVKWDIKLINEQTTAQAVVLNSGVANACTGKLGEENNEIMAAAVAKELQISPHAVLTASTGVIGKQLPIETIVKGTEELVKTLDFGYGAGNLAAEAIMTTDTYKKESAVEFILDGKVITIGGMAKGSGMIHPNMATMLGVITTDISISKELLLEAIREDVQDSFNMVSVDRDSSTNDSLLILANGLAENTEIITKDDNYYVFKKALHMVTRDLAQQMAADGEGATKLFEVIVKGTEDKQTAITLSKSIITSNLVKTAVYGNDANWGRILCAMGYSGAEFDPDKVDLMIESEFGALQLVADGMAVDYSEEQATKILSAMKVTAIADVKAGGMSATAWGCDLTYDYIKINADYRS